MGDLWSVMQFLNPGLLGTEGEFKRNYFMPIQAERDEGATQRFTAGHRSLHSAAAQDRPGHHQRPAREDGNQRILYPDQGASDPV